MSRLTFLFIVASLSLIGTSLASGAKSQNLKKVRVSLMVQNGDLKDILADLKRTSGFSFVYSEEIGNITNVHISAKHTTLYEVLTQISEQKNLRFNQSNYMIAVVKVPKPQQSGRITGLITDDQGMPLASASIRITELNRSVSADSDGRFTISVAPGTYTLEASYISFNTQQKRGIKVEEGKHLQVDFRLEAAKSDLSEVVVVGYGSQNRKDLTGSIASVKGESVTEIPTTNPIQALKGKVAGVDIFNAGNEPGGNVNIRVRGENSISASNSPLVVIDGIPVLDGLNEVNPGDVASIEILKDASATAIYGSRASNGVVLITTKRGKTGATVISYDGYYGPSILSRKLDLMDGDQFAQLRREANRTIDPNQEYSSDEDLFDDIALKSLAAGKYTDWQDLVYHDGYKQNHQLAVNGGDEKTRFATSLNYFDEQGIIKSTDFNRATFRLNLDHEVNKRLNIGVSSFVSKSKQATQSNDVYDNIVRLNPLGMPYDDEGNVLFRPNNDEGQRANPLLDIENSLEEAFKTRVFASLYGEYELFKGLKYRLNVGPDLETTRSGYFYGSKTTIAQGGSSYAGTASGNIFSIAVENILNYNKTIGTNHNLQITVLQSFQNQETTAASNDVSKLPYDSQTYHNVGSAGEIRGVGSNYQEWKLISYMGRANYNFKSKYFLTLTARADGSSRFSEGNKWGYFPSAAAAWRLSEEPFLKSVKALSDLKLRASYGMTGNTAISPYQTVRTLKTTTYVFGGTGAPGFLPGSLANSKLQWETTKQFDIGLDFGFINNRLTGTLEYYNSNTKNLLLSRSIPSSTGFRSILENIGGTSNRGVELTLSGAIIDHPNGFKWNMDMNFSKNINKINQLFGDGKDDIGNGWFIGQPINVFYDYRKIGIWQLDEVKEATKYGANPGEIKVEDIDNNGKIDANDRIILGSDMPGWIGGINTRMSYKGFEFSTVLHLRQNYLINSSWYNNSNRLAARYNNLDVDYWTPENPTNDNPRPNVNQESVYMGSTLAYKNAGFVRVRNLVIAYTFPNNWTKKIGIPSLRLNVTAENPFTLTSYKGYDPEFETSDSRAMYPSVRMYAIGLNAKF